MACSAPNEGVTRIDWKIPKQEILTSPMRNIRFCVILPPPICLQFTDEPHGEVKTSRQICHVN